MTTVVIPETRVAVLASVSLPEFANSILGSGFFEYVWWKDIKFHDDTHRGIDASFTLTHWAHNDETIYVSTKLTYAKLVKAWNEVLNDNLRSININPYDIDIDSDLADLVLQHAVYGEVVYA